MDLVKEGLMLILTESLLLELVRHQKRLNEVEAMNIAQTRISIGCYFRIQDDATAYFLEIVNFHFLLQLYSNIGKHPLMNETQPIEIRL